MPNSKDHDKALQDNGQNTSDNLELENLVDHGNKVESISSKHPNWMDLWPQLLYSALAMSPGFQAGVQAGFSSVVLPELQNDPNIKYFSKEEASWIASLSTLSGPIGGLLSGPLMDIIGRRNACILTNIPYIVSWLFAYSVNETVWPLYFARIISGCGGGMLSAASVYTSEICHPNYRGMMLCLISVFVALGTVVTFILGTFLPWKTTAIIYGVMSCLSLCGTLFLPESPCWLVSFKPSRKRYEKALKQLSRLNVSEWLYKSESRKTLEMYLRSREFNSTSSINQSQGNWINKLRRRLKLFTKRSVYAPLGILIVLFTFQEFCGVFVITSYSVNLFQGIGSNFGPGINEYSATVLMGIIRFLMTIVITIVLMRVGRKPLMLISSFGMASSMFTAAVLSSFSSTQTLDFSKSTAHINATVTTIADTDTPVNLITIVALLMFVLFASTGFLNIPWILISELLPTNVRGLGNGFIMSYALIVMSGVIKGVPFILEFINLSSLFYIFALISLSSAIYIKLYLPETFRKTFIEIEQIFKTPSKQ